MTILFIVGIIILLPFIAKLFIVYAGYFLWALKVPPIKINLNLNSKQLAVPPKKKIIGFPTILPSVVTDKKKDEK